ncbi:FAD:protein FMN transferase [uncultured Tateyamaria sp.]|uniref:FAD:protein FMN transferase n=1 Tax=uncultured Tateyamaria sp. TaxID=455651 RepID=UPI002629BCDB|nr:FAD:protein FMN transferase [uncultured Tateyamaria sp.]
MSLNRRRFLSICATFVAAPALAQPHAWTGRAFGAEVSIQLHGPSAEVGPALAEMQALITEIERLFSLYDPASDLVQLNSGGALRMSARFAELVTLADRAHRLTGGLFDPTVQPLWRAIAEGADVNTARALIGWDRVSVVGRDVRLDSGQALTFNGIAQGYATDLVSQMLRDRGFHQTLVNIGEYRGIGGPWRLGLTDPTYGLLATRTIENGAVATSSPLATPIGPHGHIVHPFQAPIWSTVSVEADTAAMADALSTGLALADMDLVRKVRATPGVRRITLVDQAGDLASL